MDQHNPQPLKKNPQLSRRSMLRASALAMGSVALAACVAPAPRAASTAAAPAAGSTAVSGTAEPTTAPAGEKVTLRMQNWFSDQDMWAWQIGLDKTKVAFPDIDVKLEYNDYGTTAVKLVAASAAGDPPDVIMASTDHTPLLASSELLLDLNPFIEAEAAVVKAEDFAPGISQGFKLWGHWWGFPYDHSTFGIYYNKTMFEAAGVDLPPGEGGKPWTLDEFVAAATKLTQPDGKQWGVVFDGLSSYLATNFVYTFGGREFDDNLRKCVINSDEAAQGIQWLVDLFIKHKVVPPVSEQKGATVDYFASGLAAMQFNGQWDLLNKNKTSTFPFDIGYLPIGTTKRSVTGGSGFTASAATKHPEAAWDFIKTYTSKDVLETMVGRTGRGIPARTSAMPAYLTAGGRATHPNVFIEQLGWSFNDRLALAFFEFDQSYQQELEPVFSGEGNVRDALAKIEATTNVAMDEKWAAAKLKI